MVPQQRWFEDFSLASALSFQRYHDISLRAFQAASGDTIPSLRRRILLRPRHAEPAGDGFQT